MDLWQQERPPCGCWSGLCHNLCNQAQLFRFDFAADGVSFEISMDGISATFDLPKLGQKDVALSLGPRRMTTRLPVADVAAPWQFDFKLDNIATNAAEWAVLDPSGGFGHDPAQIDLDLSGVMTMSVAQILAKQNAVIYAMDLNRLVLQALGALSKPHNSGLAGAFV